jgi:hypothetical protein
LNVRIEEEEPGKLLQFLTRATYEKKNSVLNVSIEWGGTWKTSPKFIPELHMKKWY